MKKQYLWFIILSFLVVSCELEQMPEATTSREAVFSNAQGLALYTNSFYTMLPNGNGSTTLDAMSDYLAVKELPTFLQAAFAPTNSSGWDWGDLRNINYFLQYNVDPKVPDSSKKKLQRNCKILQGLFLF